jgi:hypothetical protein
MTPPAPNQDPRTTPERPGLPADRQPEVIVDFHVERGLLFVMLKNIGTASAYGVVTRFDQPFCGLGGGKNITEMALFRELEFLPPGKQFAQLVDPVSTYFSRREPVRLTATVTYANRDGRHFEDVMRHNLQVYRELGDVDMRDNNSEP